MFEKFFRKPIEEIEKQEPSGQSPEAVLKDVVDLGNEDPDFVGFGEGTIAVLKDKIGDFLAKKQKNKDEERIQEIKDSII